MSARQLQMLTLAVALLGVVLWAGVRADAANSMTATPTTGLTNGSVITVQLTDWGDVPQVDLFQCNPHPQSLDDCAVAETQTTVTIDFGLGQATFIARVLFGPVECHQGHPCSLVAVADPANLGTTSTEVTLSFGDDGDVTPSTTTTTTTPASTTTTSMSTTTTTTVPGEVLPVAGGGSSFPAIEIDYWRATVAKPPYNVRVHYQDTGSSNGRTGFSRGNDFGVSDIPYQPGFELDGLASLRPGYAMIPISSGGLAFMYNLKDATGHRIEDLKLRPRTVCAIFTGYITRWNDKDIVADTGHPMPDQQIYPVIRAEGSGQSFVLSQYCIDQAKDVWDGFIDKLNAQPGPLAFDKEPTSNWPTGWGTVRAANFTAGVADAVADPTNGDNTIGYVEAGFAQQRHIPVASVQNASGQFTQPTAKNVAGTLKNAPLGSDGTYALNFGATGATVYNPSMFSYAIVPTENFNPAKGRTLGIFLNYALTEGQARAETLGYAPLPRRVVTAALDQVRRIPGAPRHPRQPLR